MKGRKDEYKKQREKKAEEGKEEEGREQIKCYRERQQRNMNNQHWSEKAGREREIICMMFIKSWINETFQQLAGR